MTDNILEQIKQLKELATKYYISDGLFDLKMLLNYIKQIPDSPFGKAIADIIQEYQFAEKKFGLFHSAHEGYAVLKEEVDELWDSVKTNDTENALKEAVQVGAMALKFITSNTKTGE